jgi:hypothetical protein
VQQASSYSEIHETAATRIQKKHRQLAATKVELHDRQLKQSHKHAATTIQCAQRSREARATVVQRKLEAERTEAERVEREQESLKLRISIAKKAAEQKQAAKTAAEAAGKQQEAASVSKLVENVEKNSELPVVGQAKEPAELQRPAHEVGSSGKPLVRAKKDYSAPDDSSWSMLKGDVFTFEGEVSGWFKVSLKTKRGFGYIPPAYCHKPASSVPASVAALKPPPGSATPPPPSSKSRPPPRAESQDLGGSGSARKQTPAPPPKTSRGGEAVSLPVDMPTIPQKLRRNLKNKDQSSFDVRLFRDNGQPLGGKVSAKEG